MRVPAFCSSRIRVVRERGAAGPVTHLQDQKPKKKGDCLGEGHRYAKRIPSLLLYVPYQPASLRIDISHYSPKLAMQSARASRFTFR